MAGRTDGYEAERTTATTIVVGVMAVLLWSASSSRHLGQLPDVFWSTCAAVQKAPPCEAGAGLAPDRGPARLNDLAAAQRPHCQPREHRSSPARSDRQPTPASQGGIQNLLVDSTLRGEAVQRQHTCQRRPAPVVAVARRVAQVDDGCAARARATVPRSAAMSRLGSS